MAVREEVMKELTGRWKMKKSGRLVWVWKRRKVKPMRWLESGQ